MQDQKIPQTMTILILGSLSRLIAIYIVIAPFSHYSANT